MDGKRFQVSAPGKVILHGEHSVVHGKKAIACAIESRLRLTANSVEKTPSVLNFTIPAFNLHNIAIATEDFMNLLQDSNDVRVLLQKFCHEKFSEFASQFVPTALSCCLYGYHRVFSQCKVHPSINITIESELSIGAGLGSSAAFNCCLSAAYLLISGSISPTKDKEGVALLDETYLGQINTLAFDLEKIVHNTPSGIDNSIATYGGAVSFQNGTITRTRKIPPLALLIVDTGVPRSTKNLVEKVQEKLKNFPDVMGSILEAMHSITVKSEAQLGLLYDDRNNSEILTRIGNLWVMNQGLLYSIGVSHPAIDKICSISSKYGFPAKLTGAGGGGCVIVLLSSNKNESCRQKLIEELQESNFLCKTASLGCPGIEVKTW